MTTSHPRLSSNQHAPSGCYNRYIHARKLRIRSFKIVSICKHIRVPASRSLFFAFAGNPATGSKKMTNPADVHASAIVIDTHADTPQRFVDENWNFTDPLNGGMLNYDSAKKGHLDAQFFSIWVDPNQYLANASARRTLELIDGTLEQVRRAPDKLHLCLSSDDILATHAQGKFAVLMGIEGGHSIEDSLALLRDYYRLGVRYMTLTWSNTNNWADSSGDIDDPAIHHHDGLTPFGKQVVAEMNRLAMMVDISHVSDKTFWDVIATTRTPIIASHSSAHALTSAPRNMTDEMLLAMKKNNGVV